MNTLTIATAKVIGYSKSAPVACDFNEKSVKFRVMERMNSAQPNFWFCICYNPEVAKNIAEHLRIGDNVFLSGELCSYGEGVKRSVYLKVFSFRVCYEKAQEKAEDKEEKDNVDSMLVNNINLK